jgi:Flp pilus assembly protein TadD
LKNWKIQAAVIGVLLVVSGIAIFFWVSPVRKDFKVSRLEKQADQAVSSGQLLDAEIALRKALETEPENSGLLVKLGSVLEKEGVLDQAKTAYLTAAKLGRSADPGFYAAMVSLRLNEPEDGERLFLENLQNWPEHTPTLYQLGALMAKKGKYQEAVKYFEKITSVDPKEAEAWNNLGFCWYNLDQLEKARDMFKKALEINPNLDSAKKSLQTVESDMAGNPQDGSTAKTCKECK